MLFSELCSAVDLGVLLVGMAKKILTGMEVLEILYSSGESFSDSSCNNVSNIDS
jgi:hypothetical protein